MNLSNSNQLLAATSDIFGKPGSITPPTNLPSDPGAALGQIIGFGIQMFILIAGLLMLAYLLWGAFDWLTSGGDKAKLEKAQGKITHAVIGIVLVIVALTVFTIVMTNVLGNKFIEIGPDGWKINLPTLGNP